MLDDVGFFKVATVLWLGYKRKHLGWKRQIWDLICFRRIQGMGTQMGVR